MQLQYFLIIVGAELTHKQERQKKYAKITLTFMQLKESQDVAR